jgi:hypothetical protein
MTNRKRKRTNPNLSTKWVIPRPISDNDFEGLVAQVGSKLRPWEIPRDRAASAKVRLNNIVDYIAANMRHPPPNRKAVRLALQSATKALRRARESLRNIPNEDHATAAFNTLTIATMVSDQWLRDFSGGEFQPAVGRNRTPFGDNADLEQRETYIECAQCGFEIATELVGRIETALAPSLEWTTKINKLGGREASPYREFLVNNLASMWGDWGRPLIMGSNSSFVTFCENVFEGVGWDSTGVQSLVSRVLSKRKASQTRHKGRFQN